MISLTTWQDWIAWSGIVVPLTALAWSAFIYVRVEKKNSKGDAGLYQQLAAAFELRNFPEYREILARVYERHARNTAGFEKVAEEINSTISFLKK